MNRQQKELYWVNGSTIKDKAGETITVRDMLEVTTHLACAIGIAWEDYFESDMVTTKLNSIDWAEEFLTKYWNGEGDDYLDQLEEFADKKMGI